METGQNAKTKTAICKHNGRNLKHTNHKRKQKNTTTNTHAHTHKLILYSRIAGLLGKAQERLLLSTPLPDTPVRLANAKRDEDTHTHTHRHTHTHTPTSQSTAAIGRGDLLAERALRRQLPRTELNAALHRSLPAYFSTSGILSGSSGKRSIMSPSLRRA